MARRVLALGLWSAATLVGTGVSFAIVSAVTANVVTADIAAPDTDDLLVAPALVTTTTAVPAPTSTPAPPAPASSVAAPVGGGAEASASAATSSFMSAPATFSARGGVVTVACDGSAIRMLSARPESGYRLVVGSGGPERVDVDFVSDQGGTRVVVECHDGVARPVYIPIDANTWDGHRGDGDGDGGFRDGGGDDGHDGDGSYDGRRR